MRLMRPEAAAAVAFERELLFERVERRFDPLADASERTKSVVARLCGRQERPPSAATCCSNSTPASPVAVHCLTRLEHPLQRFGGGTALGCVGGGEFKPCQEAVRGR
jgi:hypothetical protein